MKSTELPSHIINAVAAVRTDAGIEAAVINPITIATITAEQRQVLPDCS